MSVPKLLLDDLDDAIGCIYTVHGDRCAFEKCDCYERAERLQAVLDGLRKGVIPDVVSDDSERTPE